MPRAWRGAFLPLAVNGALGVVGGLVAALAWNGVVHYKPLYRFAQADPGVTPRISESVLLILVDGLGLEPSRDLPFLNELRTHGADFESTARSPSYSRSGRAHVATGAWADIDGVTFNFRRDPSDSDNLFRAASRTGGSVTVVGAFHWPSLFGADLGLAGAAVLEAPRLAKGERGSEAKDRAFEETTATYVRSHPADLTVVDFLAVDGASHDFGAASEERRRAALRIDGRIAELVRERDLARTVIIVTSDHGHVAEGGHGGAEPEVLRTPLVLVGAGVKPRARGTARQIDVAPTVAALLGWPIPAGAQGRILLEALEVSGGQVPALVEAERRQKRAFEAAYRSALGEGVAPASTEDAAQELGLIATRIDTITKAHLAADRGRWLWIAGAMVLLPLPLLVWLVLDLEPNARFAALMAIVIYRAVFSLLVGAFGVRLSLSGINKEADIAPYLVRLSLFAVAAFLAALVLAGRKEPRVLSAALTIPYVLAVQMVAIHGRSGLLLAWRLPEMGLGFRAFVDLVELIAVAWTGAVLSLMVWARARRVGKAGAGAVSG